MPQIITQISEQLHTSWQKELSNVVTDPKKLLQMAGIEDCYTSARGSTGTLGNFGKFFK